MKRCNKFKHFGRLDAVLALSRMSGKERAEKRIYHCPSCGYWHLTSKSRRRGNGSGEVT